MVFHCNSCNEMVDLIPPVVAAVIAGLYYCADCHIDCDTCGESRRLEDIFLTASGLWLCHGCKAKP